MPKKKTHNRFVKELNSLAPNLRILSTYTNSKSPIRVRCSVCGNERTVTSAYLLNFPSCPQCAQKERTLHKASEFRKYVENNYENIELLDEYVNITTKVRARCKICGAEFLILPHKHFGNNATPIRCKNCADGVSYPNKFVRAVLNQLPVDCFIPEWRPDWSKSGFKSYYFYDNYFTYHGNEYVVEVDGGFHYQYNNMRNCPASVTQENDREKENAAIEHGINVIRVDAQCSSADYLKDSILKGELNSLFDLSDVDWNRCERLAVKSRLIDVCYYYHEHQCQVQELGQIFHVGRNTISRYLRAGTALGFCNYVPKRTHIFNKER